MSSHFSPASLKFLRGLARHNDKAWFEAHRQDYEAHVRQPFLRLITDLQPALAAVSPHFRADPRTVGGSLFRIHRDARFSSDKSPYKPWQGARLFHERRRFALDDTEVLSRAPRGFPADFEFIDDLKHRNWVFWRPLDDATMTGPRLRRTLEADLVALGPLIDYLCAALDLEF